MKVVSDVKNGLFGRREVKLIFEAEKNLGFSACRKKVVEQFKAQDDLVVVNRVGSKFGRNTFLVDAFIYDNQDVLKKFAPKVKAKKSEAGK